MMGTYNPRIVVGNEEGQVYIPDQPDMIYGREHNPKDDTYGPVIEIKAYRYETDSHIRFYVGEPIEIIEEYGKARFNRKIGPSFKGASNNLPRDIHQTYNAIVEGGHVNLRFEMVGTGGFIVLTVIRDGVPQGQEIHIDLNEIEDLKFAVMNADGDMEYLND